MSLASDNNIVPFKERAINLEERVQVYRNLHRTGRTYSVKQKGLVVAHATRICLRDCNFVVQEKSRQRCLKTGEKNVHAWIDGFISGSGMGTTAAKNDLAKLTYNPKVDKGFMHSLTIEPKPVKHADFVICNEDGVGAAYFSCHN
jgi:hypothetical protein